MKRKVFEARQGSLNYDVDAASDESALRCEDPSLTNQSQAVDADINVIVKRFGITGQFPEGARLPSYQDFEGIFDFRTAQEAVITARQRFMALPPEVRSRFGNDPAAFVDFASDPKNLPAMREMGLAPPAKTPPAEKTLEAGAAPAASKPSDTVVT